MPKVLIVKEPEQCGYYGCTCGDCFHPKAKKWAGCGGEISKDCPLPDLSILAMIKLIFLKTKGGTKWRNINIVTLSMN